MGISLIQANLVESLGSSGQPGTADLGGVEGQLRRADIWEHHTAAEAKTAISSWRWTWCPQRNTWHPGARGQPPSSSTPFLLLSLLRASAYLPTCWQFTQKQRPGSRSPGQVLDFMCPTGQGDVHQLVQLTSGEPRACRPPGLPVGTC